MNRPARGALGALAILLGAVFVMMSLPRAAVSQDEVMNPTQARMRGVFLTLTTAYKYSLDSEAFEDPVNQERIRASLQALVANASELETHGGGLDPSFDYLRRSLARDANEALDRFNQRQFVGSRFLLTRLTENCVTCHSKLPSENRFELGASFLKEAGVGDLPPLTRVDVEIATRQFDRGLKTYEGIFADKEQKPQNLALVGAFEEYLRVCIGVMDDRARAARTLRAFRKRQDVPETLGRTIDAWVLSLEGLDLKAAGGQELFVAREMIDKARAAKRHVEDRTQLVEFIGAASLLHRYLQEGDHEDVESAEALYLLAIAESNISRSYWVSETAALLEQAVRTAPKSAVGRQALTFYEEYTLSGHAVTAREVPENVDEKLEELRALVYQ